MYFIDVSRCLSTQLLDSGVVLWPLIRSSRSRSPREVPQYVLAVKVGCEGAETFVFTVEEQRKYSPVVFPRMST